MLLANWKRSTNECPYFSLEALPYLMLTLNGIDIDLETMRKPENRKSTNKNFKLKPHVQGGGLCGSLTSGTKKNPSNPSLHRIRRWRVEFFCPCGLRILFLRFLMDPPSSLMGLQDCKLLHIEISARDTCRLHQPKERRVSQLQVIANFPKITQQFFLRKRGKRKTKKKKNLKVFLHSVVNKKEHTRSITRERQIFEAVVVSTRLELSNEFQEL
ncbi:unnamed protein product [Citrullus colocynthis]|uniref:Uncharacterized protein n=1 Tax=Citrullus colocynthis TaxID=252529 RepID=A0ABP0Y5U0_9ROSI